jgi:pimeloyl-ACP methyl ester carboxylesterase
MNSDQWQYNIADLTESGHRCIAFDRRGHGRSDRPRGGYSGARLADDIATVLDALDVENATLVGHSFGAFEAASYVARHGTARVNKLGLLAPTLPLGQKSADNPDGIDRAMIDALLGYWRTDYADWLVRGPSNVELFYRLEAFPISRGIVEWSVDMMRSTSSIMVQLACGAVLADADPRGDLARLGIPTLVIHGDHDASMPVSFGRATAKLIPGARYIEYKGAPHGLFLTHRERLHGDISAFVAGSAKAGTSD